MTDTRSDRPLPEFQLPAGAFELSDLRGVETHLLSLPEDADLAAAAHEQLGIVNKGTGAQLGFDPAQQPGFVQKTFTRSLDPLQRDPHTAGGEPDPASLVEETIWVYDPASTEQAPPAAEATAAEPSTTTAPVKAPGESTGEDAAPQQE